MFLVLPLPASACIWRLRLVCSTVWRTARMKVNKGRLNIMTAQMSYPRNLFNTSHPRSGSVFFSHSRWHTPKIPRLHWSILYPLRNNSRNSGKHNLWLAFIQISDRVTFTKDGSALLQNLAPAQTTTKTSRALQVTRAR